MDRLWKRTELLKLGLDDQNRIRDVRQTLPIRLLTQFMTTDFRRISQMISQSLRRQDQETMQQPRHKMHHNTGQARKKLYPNAVDRNRQSIELTLHVGNRVAPTTQCIPSSINRNC